MPKKGLVTKVVEAARRSGKSRAAFGEMLYAYGEAWNFIRGPALIPSFLAWIVVPTDDTGKQTWREVVGLFPRELVDRADHSEMRLYLKGSPNWVKGTGYGVIEVKSAFNPDALQNAGLDYLWVNEAHDISEAAFTKLLPSTVSHHRLGKRIYEGIPALYPDHWFRKAYLYACRKVDHRIAAFKMTYLDNPLLTAEQKGEVESHREYMTEASWLRMYMAEYNESAGFFHNIDQCISGDFLTEPLPGRVYVAGLDIGLAQDPSELFVLDRDSRRVVQWLQMKGIPWVQQRERILALNETWRFEQLVYDATSLGGVMAGQDFASTNLAATPFTITARSRQELLETLASATERGNVSFPFIRPLQRQFQVMQTRQTPTGWKLDVPAGEHDDCVFALALALTACAPPSPVGQTRGAYRSTRYLPTQAEAEAGGIARPMPQGMRRRLERRSMERMKRLEAAGMEV